MSGILDGIKILEMGHVVAVPSASVTMADWGADVLKIEPLTGDMARGFMSIMGVNPMMKNEQGETSWYVHLLNRNKKSLALNLKTDAGREVVYKLLQEYDVFMSNYEYSSLKRLKVDYNTLSQFNPRLVYGLLTGYGTVGPDKDEKGFDHTAAWARTGIQNSIGAPGGTPPLERGGMMDRTQAAHIVGGILAAMLHRERTGEGQAIEFSLYHTGVWTVAEDIQAALMGTPIPQWDRTKAFNPLFNNYQAKDGRWFQLAMLQADLHWSGFCIAIDRPELEKEARFVNLDKREENRRELIRILDEIFALKTRAEWEKRFKEYDCIYGRIETSVEVTTDPQALDNDFFASLSHPVMGEVKLVNTPVKFLQNPASIRYPAPEIGQHTEEILLELGYSWDEIGHLKEQGIIL